MMPHQCYLVEMKIKYSNRTNRTNRTLKGEDMGFRAFASKKNFISRKKKCGVILFDCPELVRALRIGLDPLSRSCFRTIRVVALSVQLVHSAETVRWRQCALRTRFPCTTFAVRRDAAHPRFLVVSSILGALPYHV